MSYMLSYPLFEKGIEFKENQVLQVVIENKKAFYDFLTEISLQINGCESNVVISKELNDINLHNKAELLIDYLNITENEKSILQKLYSVITSLTENSSFINERNELNSLVCSYIEKLSDELDVSIEYSSAIDFKLLLKAIDVKVNDKCNDTLGDKLINFTKMKLKLLNKDVFILVNIKSFLSDEELEGFYKYMLYNKILVIIIESKEISRLGCEKTVIIDNDLCQIC